MPYLVESELIEIAAILKNLNDNMAGSGIAIGKAPLYDSNGDTIGHVDICDGGMYALILGDTDE